MAFIQLFESPVLTNILSLCRLLSIICLIFITACSKCKIMLTLSRVIFTFYSTTELNYEQVNG